MLPLKGMHPDQATESIIDAALLLNLPCAVVPCCVFPSLFPHRRVSQSAIDAYANGTLGRGHASGAKAGDETVESNTDASIPVVTYNEFLAYLLAKDARLQLHYLPIKGRNRVIFFDPNATKE